MRRLILAVVLIALVVGVSFLLRKTRPHRMELVTYFRHATALKAGAVVRVDGVDVGTVLGVRVRPELGDRPVEVVMAISTTYNLAIPNDATVQLGSDGVLGPAIVDIDTRHSSGVPVKDHGTLNSVELTDNQAAKAVQRVGNAFVQALKQQTPAASQAPKAK